MTQSQTEFTVSLRDYWHSKVPDDNDRDVTKGAITAYSIMPMYPSFIIAIRADRRLRIAGVHLSKKEITIRLCSYGRRALHHHPVFAPLISEINELYKRAFSMPSSNDAIMAIWNHKADMPTHPKFKSIIFIGVEPRGYIDEMAEVLGLSRYTLTALLFYVSLEGWDFEIPGMPFLCTEVDRNLTSLEYILRKRIRELEYYVENHGSL